MPLVTITVRRGRSEVETQAISEGIHRSLVEEIGIPDADFNHRIIELDAARVPTGDRGEHIAAVEGVADRRQKIVAGGDVADDVLLARHHQRQHPVVRAQERVRVGPH